MKTFLGGRALSTLLGVTAVAATSFAQATVASLQSKPATLDKESSVAARPLVVSVLANYYSQTDGVSLKEIVKRAFDTNGEIRIARLEIDKARARAVQAGLRPNPTLDFEQSSGWLAGSPGESEFSAGISVPLELFGRRKRRIDVANAEIALKEAEITAHQRNIASQVFMSYTEALAALRELQVSDELLTLDVRTVEFVQIRVNEGETPPLELSLLQTEVERLRARRQLVEGRLQAALTKLRFYAGMQPQEPFKLREDISSATLPLLPPSIDTGIAVGLRNRPEIRLAELEQQLASSGLRLVNSQAKPGLTTYSKFRVGRSSIDLPTGPYPQDRDRLITFGVAIDLPLFNKNQGAKAEAAISIRQAQERRAFTEQLIKNEIAIAFQRIEAANKSLLTLETSVLPRSRQNVETFRRIYELGEVKITDLIAEQRRMLDANRDLTEALTERYRAQADLFIALGITL